MHSVRFCNTFTAVSLILLFVLLLPRPTYRVDALISSRSSSSYDSGLTVSSANAATNTKSQSQHVRQRRRRRRVCINPRVALKKMNRRIRTALLQAQKIIDKNKTPTRTLTRSSTRKKTGITSKLVKASSSKNSFTSTKRKTVKQSVAAASAHHVSHSDHSLRSALAKVFAPAHKPAISARSNRRSVSSSNLMRPRSSSSSIAISGHASLAHKIDPNIICKRNLQLCLEYIRDISSYLAKNSHRHFRLTRSASSDLPSHNSIKSSHLTSTKSSSSKSYINAVPQEPNSPENSVDDSSDFVDFQDYLDDQQERIKLDSKGIGNDEVVNFESDQSSMDENDVSNEDYSTSRDSSGVSFSSSFANSMSPYRRYILRRQGLLPGSGLARSQRHVRNGRVRYRIIYI